MERGGLADIEHDKKNVRIVYFNLLKKNEDDYVSKEKSHVFPYHQPHRSFYIMDNSMYKKQNQGE